MNMHQYLSAIGLVSLLVTAPLAAAQDVAEQQRQVLAQLKKTSTAQTVFDSVSFQLAGPVVILMSFTIRPGLKDESERVIRALDWAQHVVNHVEVLPIGAPTERIRSSSETILRDAVPQAFPGNRVDIRIKVKSGAVTLVGSISSVNQRRLENAVSRLRALPEVRSVENQVTVRDGD